MEYTTDDDAFVDAGPGAAKSGSFWEWLSEANKDTPNKVAMSILHQPASHFSQLKLGSEVNAQIDHLEWTYGDLEAASARLRTALQAQGIREGDTMITFLENRIEWIICFLATIRLGVVMAPLDAQMTGRPEELAE